MGQVSRAPVRMHIIRESVPQFWWSKRQEATQDSTADQIRVEALAAYWFVKQNIQMACHEYHGCQDPQVRTCAAPTCGTHSKDTTGSAKKKLLGKGPQVLVYFSFGPICHTAVSRTLVWPIAISISIFILTLTLRIKKHTEKKTVVIFIKCIASIGNSLRQCFPSSNLLSSNPLQRKSKPPLPGSRLPQLSRGRLRPSTVDSVVMGKAQATGCNALLTPWGVLANWLSRGAASCLTEISSLATWSLCQINQ